MQKKTTTLIYGTGNAGKLDLMRHYLSTLQEIRLLGLKDLPFCWGEIEECGKDPLENARQKALAYYRICGQPVFSQDSGLYIDAACALECVHRRTAQGASAGRACTAGKRCQPDG